MINVTELRIGNLISERGNYRVYPVNEILKYGVRVKCFSCGESELISQRNLMPVLLSEDILMKAGFNKCSPETSPNVGVDMGKSYISPFARKRLILSFDDNGPDQINTYWIENVGMGEASLTFDIKYVHQLQNLFYSLFGEELKITI